MSGSALSLARKDILALKPYSAAQQIDDTIRLNANEAPVCSWDGNASDGLNRYPEARPCQLTSSLSRLFDVPEAHLLVTRGSSEAIDALIRAFCEAYVDSIITTPPTFEMYRIYANIQGVDMIDVPLDSTRDFALDPGQVLDAAQEQTKLIFLCAPNNPTGSMVSVADVLEIAEARRERSIVVVDEAYIEFTGTGSLATQVGKLDNLVVLRTLSKAHALAGARCGAAIACPEVIDVISRVLPPYTFPTPVIRCVIDALSDAHLAASAGTVNKIIDERQRILSDLEKLPIVEKVWPSSANFVLVKFRNMQVVAAALANDKVLIRDFSSYPQLENCARITVGTFHENNALLRVLGNIGGDSGE